MEAGLTEILNIWETNKNYLYSNWFKENILQIEDIESFNFWSFSRAMKNWKYATGDVKAFVPLEKNT